MNTSFYGSLNDLLSNKVGEDYGQFKKQFKKAKSLLEKTTEKTAITNLLKIKEVFTKEAHEALPQIIKIDEFIDEKIAQMQAISTKKLFHTPKLSSISSIIEHTKSKELPPRKEASQNVLQNWRSSVLPTITYDQLSVDLTGVSQEVQETVKKKCLDQYAEANKAMEKAIGRTCLQFVRKNGSLQSEEAGPLLEFSRTCSTRFLDMYQAYVKFEAMEKIPIIPNVAGQLKNHGFTSQEIIEMHPICQEFTKLSEEIKTEFFSLHPTDKKKALENYQLFIKMLTSKDETRTELEKTFSSSPNLQHFVERYRTITPNGNIDHKIIDRVFFMMLNFGHTDVTSILDQIYEISTASLSTPGLKNEWREIFERSKTLTSQETEKFFTLVNPLLQFVSKLETYFSQNNKTEVTSEFITQIMFDPQFAQDFLHKHDLDPHMKLLVEKFLQLPSLDIIIKGWKVISQDRPPLAQIQRTLKQIAIKISECQGDEESRLLMEIRHRVGGDGSSFQSAPGSIGQSPLGYINAIVRGDPDNNLEAEFRQQMYFVYMSNHFANNIIANPKLVEFINKELENKGKGWKINTDFLQAMESREPKFLPPIFRYGGGALLNSLLRDVSHEKLQNKHLPIFKELQQDTAPLDSNFRYKLSKRELLNQFGEIYPEKIDPNVTVQFSSGEGAFHLHTLNAISDIGEKADAARTYVQMTQDLRIPCTAGISGTLDQSIAMAGLIGIGISDDPAIRTEELQNIKRAYLAFMVPNNDHSVFEIMFSAAISYGLKCHYGQGIEQDIYPENSNFINLLETELNKQGFKLPGYYLSNENALKNVTTKKPGT